MPLVTIALREFQTIWRDKRIRTVVLFAPFLYAILFCFVYSKHTLLELPIAVVNEDNSYASRTLIRMLEASPRLTVEQRAYSLDELKDLIFDRSIVAAIVIPKNFARTLKRGHDNSVVAYVNAASMVSANIAAKAISEVVLTFSAGVEIKSLMKKGERLSSALEKFQPIKLDLRTLFNPSFNYTNFLLPGLLIAILQQVILLGVALSWTGEKESNTLHTLFAISKSPITLLAGKALPYLLINSVVAEFFLRVLFPLNDIPMEGNWHIAIPFTLLFILTIVTWGMWVSGLCKTRLFATQALMFVAMPSFILSGFTWPPEGMPLPIQWLSQCLPMTYFVNSFRNIYLAAAPFRFVYQDFLILLAFTGLNIVLGVVIVKQLVKRMA